MAIALLLAILTMVVFAGWLLNTSTGLRWIASIASGSSSGALSMQGIRGTLLGPIDIQTLKYKGGDKRVAIREIRFEWKPASLLAGHLEITMLKARNVEVVSPPSEEPLKLPQDLRLPLSISIRKLEIGSLQIIRQTGSAPDFAATSMTARFDSNGRQHHLNELRASMEYGELSASAQADGDRPFKLQAIADLSGHGTSDVHIKTKVSGDLENLTLKAQGSGTELNGQGEALLQPFREFPLARLNLAVKGLNPRAFSSDAPQASLSLQAQLSQNAAGKLEGEVTAKNISPAPLNQDGLPLIETRTRATLSADSLQFDALDLILAGSGHISGHVSWQFKTAAGTADLTIIHLDPAALDTRLRPARLDGTATLSGDSQTQQGLIKLRDGKLSLEASLSRNAKTLTVNHIRLAHGPAALSGRGEMESGRKRPFTFRGKFEQFDVSAFLQGPRSDLNAEIEATGELSPQTKGNLSFTIGRSKFSGHALSGNGQIAYVDKKRFSGKIELRLGDNLINAHGAYGSPGEQLELTLNAPVLAQFDPAMAGTLYAHATLAGTMDNPEMAFQIQGKQLTLPGSQHLESLNADGKLHAQELHFKAEATHYQQATELLIQSMTISLQGGRSHLALSAKALLLKDTRLEMQASGGLISTEKGWRNLQWQGFLSTLTATGPIPVRLLAATAVEFGKNHISLGKAEFGVAGGKVQLAHTEWTPKSWSSRGSFGGIGLRPGGVASESQAGLRLAGDWDVSASPLLLGKFHIHRESGDWELPGDQPTTLGIQDIQINAQARDNRLSADMKARGVRLGEWSGNIAMPLSHSASAWTIAPEAPLNGKVNVSMSDLSWIGPALDSNTKNAGNFTLAADLSGTFSHPHLHGKLSGNDLSFALLDQGVRLQNGQLAARLDQTKIYIDQLSFQAPHLPIPRDPMLKGINLAKDPGSITLTGMIDPITKRGDLNLIARRIPLEQSPDRWIIASGQGRISFEQETLTLGGKITADAGLISQPEAGKPQLADDIVITGRQTSSRAGPRITVDAILDLGEQFFLRAAGLEARLAGQLHVRGAPAKPIRVSGSISTHDATFKAYGQNLVVERGIVNFQGPIDDPGLNILALRKNLPVEAGVTITGRLRRPVVRLVSTPNVPDPEKLSWIVLGRAPDAGGSDSSLLFSAAGSILGGQSGGITSQLAQALGFDELSLNQAQNGDPLAGQIISVGKRLSTKAFLSYEQGLNAVAGTTKLTYALTPRISIVTRAGSDNAIDVFYTFHFD